MEIFINRINFGYTNALVLRLYFGGCYYFWFNRNAKLIIGVAVIYNIIFISYAILLSESIYRYYLSNMNLNSFFENL